MKESALEGVKATRTKAGNLEVQGELNEVQRRWLPTWGKRLPSVLGNREGCRPSSLFPALEFFLFWAFLWELSRKTDGQVSALQADPGWKVQESEHCLRKLIILIIPSSTGQNSKLRNYRKAGHERISTTVPLGRQILRQHFDIFFWCLLSTSFFNT